MAIKNNKTSSHKKQRECFRAPIPEIYDVSILLKKAVEAHNKGDRQQAAKLIKQADQPPVKNWYLSISGKFRDDIHNFIPVENLQETTPAKTKSRMPSASVKKALITRDGYHCRYCNIPVIRSEIRDLIRKNYPDVLQWGKSNKDRHAAFLGLWLTYEHVIPHSLGGDNSLDNMIISCQACNCGKSNYSLEDFGLLDPRNSPVIKSQWNGLENFKGG